MPGAISDAEWQAAHNALVAFGQARTFREQMRVPHDNRDALLSDAAILITEMRVADLKASGNNKGASDLARVFYQLRSNLESPAFMKDVNRFGAEEDEE